MHLRIIILCKIDHFLHASKINLERKKKRKKTKYRCKKSTNKQ